MSWCEIAARARGLTSRLASEEALAAIDAARDAGALARALAEGGFAVAPHAGAIEQEVGAIATRELALLSRRDRRALAAIELDEDRRTLRGLLRGLAAEVPAERRIAGAIATAGLPASALARLAGVASPGALAGELARLAHPFASALAAVAETPSGAVDVLAAELALARAFAAEARAACDRAAMRTHVAQVIDTENAAAARLIAARGAELDATAAFLAGGERVDRATFATACADAQSPRLALAFAGTPLAGALAASAGRTPALEDAAPAGRTSALEDAALAWHLATQARLRRLEPEGPATVLYHVLRRRLVARHLRRAAWRLALLRGGAR